MNVTAGASLTRRLRLTILAGIAAVAGLAWVYLFTGAAMMDMTGAITEVRPWTVEVFVLMALMWAVMMVAMMLPSVAPAVLIYATISKRLEAAESGKTAVFVTGYVLAWSLFSLGAASLQWGLERLLLLSPMMAATSSVLGGVLLITAGLYQFSTWKESCLAHCRTPLEFLSRHWRPGTRGALGMGLRHGFFCIGCCWAVMGLLFIGGVMNLLWVALIAVFVLLEKLAPAGWRIGFLSGAILLAAGLWILVRGLAGTA